MSNLRLSVLDPFNNCPCYIICKCQNQSANLDLSEFKAGLSMAMRNISYCVEKIVF